MVGGGGGGGGSDGGSQRQFYLGRRLERVEKVLNKASVREREGTEWLQRKEEERLRQEPE